MTTAVNHSEANSSKFTVTAGRFEVCLREGHPSLALRKLPGIGPRLEQSLIERGVRDQRDLLLVLPRRYNQLLRFPDGATLARTQPERAMLYAEVVSVQPPGRWSRRPLEVIVQCGNERIVLVWFNINSPRFSEQFRTGRGAVVEGAIDWSRGLPRMTHPVIDWSKEPPGEAASLSFDPVYPTLDPVGTKTARRAIVAAFEALEPFLVDIVPTPRLEDLDLGSVAGALRALHGLDGCSDPTVFEASLCRARDRLVYEEFYTLQRRLALTNLALRARGAAPRQERRELGREFVRSLPFELTGDQRKVITIIADELGLRVPMRRLLQGDVGSGKTVVAFMAAAIVTSNGNQTALLAPTEVLATQHYQRAIQMFGGLKVRVGLLAGSTPVKQRRQLLSELEAGRIDLLIGTHALLTEDVQFAGAGEKLGLVIVDEQHKFGVEQRDALLAKGRDPHLMAMTATPIPRSLAHAIFGDLELAVLREKPPGREPVRTYLRSRDARVKVYEWLREQVGDRGHRAYVVYPLIEAAAPEREFANLLAGAEELANGPLRGLRVGILHGKMASSDKLSIMRRFEAGEIDVLCSTTVIEVGVDVPEATVMVVESPEAFGLSQLHQLRGRVGRGDATSRCILLHGDQLPPETLQRLTSFTTTSDGFELAEIDLVMRGPGEFLGARQSGAAEFRFADIVRDREWLELAREDARRELYGPLATHRP